MTWLASGAGTIAPLRRPPTPSREVHASRPSGLQNLGDFASTWSTGLRSRRAFYAGGCSTTVKLAKNVADGRLIGRQLYATADCEVELPGVCVHDIDSWVKTTTQLISSQARMMTADGIDPAAATG